MLNNIILDVKLEILSHLSGKSLTLLSLTCCEFFDIISKYNLIEVRKYHGFPRVDGHCKIHEIHEYIKYSKLSNYFNMLLDNVPDLIRGDVLREYVYHEGNRGMYYNNVGTYMFDGCKIVSLDFDLYQFGTIPNEFTVIEHNVPLKYWHDTLYFYNGGGNMRVINYMNLVNVNMSTIREQCIKNIKEDGKIRFVVYGPSNLYNNMIYTTFVYNDIEYNIQIVQGYSTVRKQDYTDFIKYISKTSIVSFCVDTHMGFRNEIPNSIYAEF